MAVRQRVIENSGGEGVGGGGHSSLLDESLRGRTQQKRQLNLDWQHLFWMLTSFVTLYMTNFASHLLFNDNINRIMLVCSILLLGVAAVAMVFAMIRHPQLNQVNWHSVAPVPVAMGTLTCITGGILFVISVWPVWRWYTLLITPVLVMGGVSTVALFNL